MGTSAKFQVENLRAQSGNYTHASRARVYVCVCACVRVCVCVCVCVWRVPAYGIPMLKPRFRSLSRIGLLGLISLPLASMRASVAVRLVLRLGHQPMPFEQLGGTRCFRVSFVR